MSPHFRRRPLVVRVQRVRVAPKPVSWSQMWVHEGHCR
ncbi:hypothetical protein FHS34_002448 [Streptomyces echinatus]|uniref:Uncharacterized protein n=1 Tax=Streptomyces echinatus TaxID=67293 RepID=A0A7W9PTH5_9ACTN|nr:hypothetical protein [Streptomyces echinatus]